MWVVSDDDCMVFVAAPTSGAARFARHEMWTGDRQDALAQTVRRVLEDGTIAERVWHRHKGGSVYYTLPPRQPQATINVDRTRSLTDSEAAALGWRSCIRCDEGQWAHNASGLCDHCESMAEDEEQDADLPAAAESRCEA